MHRIVGRARLAGEVGRAGAGQQHRLVVGLGDFQNGKADGRIDQIGDGVDAVEIEPAPRDGGADIGLVLMIGGDDLDRNAVDLVAELFGRHLGRFDRAGAGILLIRPGKIGEHADLDLAARHVGMRGRNQAKRSGERADNNTHDFPPERDFQECRPIQRRFVKAAKCDGPLLPGPQAFVLAMPQLQQPVGVAVGKLLELRRRHFQRIEEIPT